ELGLNVVAHSWDTHGCDWSQFDCVVVRSAWDYHLRPEEYAQWVRSFNGQPTRLWNPPRAILENLDKRYLVDLANKGLNVVPTIYQAASEGIALQEIFERCGWDEIVIKPSVSASARGTWRSSLATATRDQTKFAEQLSRQDVLIQPYLPEVASQ